MNDFDGKFMQDEDLKDLLRQWRVPETPASLDNRVAATYQQSTSQTASVSALYSQRDSEVVNMKFCNTCQEEFADRFSFCPVDGTPLTAAPVAAASQSAPAETVSPVETVTAAPAAFSVPATVSAAPAAVAAGNIGEFHLTILEDSGLVSRLAGELGNVAHNYQLTWPEFKRDPFGFVKRSFQGYGKMAGKFFSSRDVVIASVLSIVSLVLHGWLAIYVLDKTQGCGGPSRQAQCYRFGHWVLSGCWRFSRTWLSTDRGAAVMGAKPSDSRNVLSGIVAAFAVLFLLVGGVFSSTGVNKRLRRPLLTDEVELTQMISEIPNEQPTPDEGTAGMAKGSGGGSKAEKIKPGGGGGGGREQQQPASMGKLPQASLTIPQVVAPNPNPPPIKNPSLPMPATLDADPVLFPPDTRNLAYGDPKSKSTTLSSGPGTGNGIGTGTRWRRWARFRRRLRAR